MAKVTASPGEAQPDIEQRKADHIRINLEEDVQFPRLTTGLERYRFIHQALPELNLEDIDTSQELFGRVLRVPLLISSMTGGTEQARQISRTPGAAAQAPGMARGRGSWRAALGNPHPTPPLTTRRAPPDT